MSIDYGDIRRTLRTRALTLEVCTTGSTTLAATVTGYTRSAGSFLTDGFRRGMEITASGFTKSAANGTGVVTAVTATVLTVSAYTVAYNAQGKLAPTARSLVADAAAAGRTISVGLPAMRAWENLAFDSDPLAPWVEEQLVGGPSRRPGLVNGGVVEFRPMYALHVHALEDTGAEAPDAYADALINLFPAGQPMTLASGDTLRVRNETGSYRGQLVRRRAGFATVPVNVPLWVYIAQTITA